MAVMDEKKKGEIAVKLVKYFLRKKGVHFSAEAKRDIGNIAKEIGVPVDEINLFIRPIFDEIFDEVFRDQFSSKREN